MVCTCSLERCACSVLARVWGPIASALYDVMHRRGEGLLVLRDAWCHRRHVEPLCDWTPSADCVPGFGAWETEA